MFPDLQVVHMLRDGRDVVQSFMRVSEAGLPYFARAWLRAVRAAQAFGDRQALAQAGRRLIRFHLDTNVIEGLHRLNQTLV